jgi:cytochrome c oxidase cbb3-type subunit 1
MVLYFMTCLQCAFQTTLTFQKIIHFSDWVVGHARHVRVFSFWLLGVMVYLIPRLVKRPWYSEELLEYHFWLTAKRDGGDVPGSCSRHFQGFVWAAARSVGVDQISLPFWWVRIVTGLASSSGKANFFWNSTER